MIWMCQEEYRLGYNVIKCGILKQSWAKLSNYVFIKITSQWKTTEYQSGTKESDIKGLHCFTLLLTDTVIAEGIPLPKWKGKGMGDKGPQHVRAVVLNSDPQKGCVWWWGLFLWEGEKKKSFINLTGTCCCLLVQQSAEGPERNTCIS